MKTLALVFLFFLNAITGLLPAAGDTGAAPEEKLYLVRNQGKCGFIDRTGRVVIPLAYDAASAFSEGLAPVKVGKLWGAIDRTGRMVISPQPYQIMGFLNGMSIVRDLEGPDRLIGFMDKAGNLPISPRFQSACSFYKNRAWVGTAQGGGFIDKSGEAIIPMQYQVYNVDFFMHGDYCLLKDRQGIPRFVHISGIVLNTPDIDLAKPYFQELAAVRSNGLWGYLNQTGQWAILPQYQEAELFSEGFAWVLTEGRWGTVDRKGKVVIPPSFKASRLFHEGLSWVWDGKGWGCVDPSGELRIPFRFSEVEDFSGGRAWVKQSGRWGVVDPRGKWLISPRFHGHQSFQEGYALVNIGGIEPSVCDAISVEEGIGGRWGLIDTKGRWVIPPRYSTVEFFDGEVGLFKKNGCWKYVDRWGRILWTGDRGDNCPIF
ncbi:MAG: WG repeat-containing protein [Acidobacteria bacterium]|nr:WG repeat-containing protein [Acidobacteriota bacterium]